MSDLLRRVKLLEVRLGSKAENPAATMTDEELLALSVLQHVVRPRLGTETGAEISDAEWKDLQRQLAAVRNEIAVRRPS